MHSKSTPKLNTFSLILGASSLLGLLAGCPISDITLPGINQSPTADAGADITIDVGQRVTLNGLGSTDADDDPLTYIWQQRSGPPVTLDGANTDQPSFVPLDKGLYEFALTVTDGRGGSDISVVRVFVGIVPPEFCPLADAGIDQTVNEGAAVRLRGGNSADPGGGPLTFDWFQLSGPQVSINGVFILEPSFAAPQVAGADIELEFELTVTNEQGCPDRDTVVITVRDRDAGDPCNGVVCGDDGRFCNGVESCDDGACVSSGDPCLEGEICDEDTDSCTVVSDCATDADCNDGLFCNGVETCVAGECQNGAAPCAASETCNEENDSCTTTECASDTDCDDGLFCNGTETCAGSVCLDGVTPCPAGDTCDEDAESCTTPECTTNADCDDDDACTIDSCTGADGTCANVAVVCDAGQECNGLTGVCQAICAVDADCDDSLFCNGAETCVGDFCQSGAASCTSDETCDEDSDECTPIDTECDTIHSSEWLTGAIDTVVDLDTYTFTGQAGQCVIIQMNRTSGGLDPEIRLFPPSGGDREAIALPDSTHKALLLVHPLAESGCYTILVRDRGGDETGDYLLSLLFLSGPLTSPQDQDGGIIDLDETISGAIDPVVDMDVYTFFGQAGQRVTIQMNRTSGGLDPEIRLFPPSGCDREAIALPDSTHKALLFVHPLVESGQYTILVRDRGGDETGDYLLSLSALP